AIYVPIYLHTYIGFSWYEIGIIFSIMLLPFIIFEWPAGELADKKFGEKEIMSLGFLIMFGALTFMPSLDKMIVAWTVALFISRIGAAFIEITTESYFFKQIGPTDSGLISIFRLARGFGLISGASTGALAIAFWPFESIFLVLAFASLLGWRVSSRLRDTR
ncbi:MAG: MFS transporter, partial [Patescibacteria group bacterium]